MRLLIVAALLAVAAAGAAAGGGAPAIEHVVVLMMENRAFDHLLGWHSSAEIDGLTGAEFNLLNASDPTSEKIFVNKRGHNWGPDDPLHDFDSTTEQIFGYDKPVGARAVPRMSGFAQNARENGNDPTNPFSMFTPDAGSAPIINQLVSEFAVFDQWHCSLPGPTDPNRAFVMSGTSAGATTNFNGTLWTQQSFFDLLTQEGVSWRAYYQDDPWAIMYFNDTHEPQNVKNIFELDQFYAHVGNGSLAAYTFLQPRMTSTYGPPTWQHPDSSVREGERLIKSLYELLRGSQFWESTAFVITYDEHGGFFDHVPPPQVGVPSPDGIASPEGFTFNRLGIRVPTVLVSPWVDAGTVIHRPDGPTPTSHYDSTSIMATFSNMFSVAPRLSDRVKWAGTFEEVLAQRSTPRTDCPQELHFLPAYLDKALAIQRARPLNEHLAIQVRFYCERNGHAAGCESRFPDQGSASDFIVREAAAYMERYRSLA